MTRRELIGFAGAVAAATTLRPPSARAAPARVIVVGAGLAGLVAALELRRAGFDVLVLEARDRVGGRVHTVRSFANGQTAEAGGEYIDTSHATLLGYVHRFGLSLDDLRKVGSDLPGAAYLRGRRVRRAQLSAGGPQRDIDRYEADISRLADRLAVGNPLAGGRALDRTSMSAHLGALHLNPRARMLIEHEQLVDDYTVAPQRLSLLAVAAAESVGPTIPESGIEAFRISGGNDRLAGALARELGAGVQLGAPVTSISWGPAGVQVTAAGELLSARFCVLATPLPPLRRVTFTPALPTGLARAIAELQYGVGTKTLLQYERRIWREQGYDGNAITDLPLSTAWEATDAQPGPSGILIAYTMGDPGRRFSALSDAARMRAAAVALDRIYPGSRRLLSVTSTIAWANEPYSGGTYTAFAPGQVTRFWSLLRRPVGPLHLAGEHTDDYWGYMEGAVRSGRRAARAIAGSR